MTYPQGVVAPDFFCLENVVLVTSTALGRLINAGLIQKIRQGKHFIYQLKN